jgi:hypothetical protein
MDTAILNVKEKTLTFNFKKEFFVLDVSDIDDDHWDTITCKDNIQYDINFWFCDLDNCWRLGVYSLKTIKGTVEVDILVCSYIVEPIEYKDNFLCENLSSSQEIKKVKIKDKHNILFEKNPFRKKLPLFTFDGRDALHYCKDNGCKVGFDYDPSIYCHHLDDEGNQFLAETILDKVKQWITKT